MTGSHPGLHRQMANTWACVMKPKLCPSPLHPRQGPALVVCHDATMWPRLGASGLNIPGIRTAGQRSGSSPLQKPRVNRKLLSAAWACSSAPTAVLVGVSPILRSGVSFYVHFKPDFMNPKLVHSCHWIRAPLGSGWVGTWAVWGSFQLWVPLLMHRDPTPGQQTHLG